MNPGPASRGGRPASLSRAAVLAAALDLFDEHGVEAVTLRRLAGTLHVSPMALYRHVADKDDLLLALVEQLAERLRFPPRPSEPREAILVLWQTLYEGLARHPWVPELLARRRMMAPSVLDAVEEIHADLLALGLDIDQAAVAYRLMWQFTLGALQVRVSSSGPGGDDTQQRVRGTPSADEHPTLAAAATAWRRDHDRDTYRADLALILDRLTSTSG